MDYQFEVLRFSDPLFAESMRIREEVFVREQNVPAELEADEFDKDAVHIVLKTSVQTVATGRYYADPENPDVAKLGRVAVLKEFRGSGFGRLVVGELLRLIRAKGNFKKVEIHSQVTVVNLYAEFGFVKIGREFNEAGIPHYEMFLNL